jgi:hypothetical protein
MTPVADAVRALYRANWGEPIRRAAFGDDVLIEVEKWVAEGVTIYATVGASNVPALHDDRHRVEFFTGLTPERDDVALALGHLALYAVTGGDEVEHGHTVPMPGPLWPGTEMRRFLVMRPTGGFLDGLDLPDGLHVVFLQAIPIFDSERELAASIGADALIDRWSKATVPFWDPMRLPSP